LIKNEKMIDSSNTDTRNSSQLIVDLSNTKIAFAHRSTRELKKTVWLFSLMNKKWLVDILSKVAIIALKLRIPFVSTIIRATIFEQFVGGRTLLECQKTIDHLYKNKVQSILDYGAEGKKSETDFNNTMNECIRAIEFAGNNETVPVVSTKITGFARFGLLEKIQKGESFHRETRKEYRNILKRIDAICYTAKERKIAVFFDAEESWIQESIDHLVGIMMKRYNGEEAIVYNTFQLYRHDRLGFLMESFDKAKKFGYILGAKLVRGAYMEKERKRAKEMGYLSPIHLNKVATDDAFITAVRFCVDNYKEMASANATHNQESCFFQAKLIHEKGIPKNHKNLNFCQLLGMSDNITFNLAQAGYNVAKYLPYGSVREITPYLIRRANENISITGDMSREAKLLMTELKRR